ncbi:J-domain-containing protein [Gandjariella thermophila]|uniref:DUF1992 domain-containing protein n=1 Tax=Gandjariella thermophila TaxID=1931992 RepID=A0A4D4JB24_9PSEU|nr:DUF1992 domain-containing protein [Gandjariella thermophila]GDY33861.1 DUF1992 domain-containing protein [Gandjariella thermophila]
MTERKPAHIGFETWVDRQIREAQERGEFDNLPGHGKPIPDLHQPYHELWWVRNYLRREGLSAEALLPTSLQLRSELSRLPDTVRDLPTERAVRTAVHALNRRILEWLRAPSGPHVRIRPVNADDVVAQWRAARWAASRAAPQSPTGRAATAEPRSSRTRWWHRFLRRRP